jgi:hypothetical protein
MNMRICNAPLRHTGYNKKIRRFFSSGEYDASPVSAARRSPAVTGRRAAMRQYVADGTPDCFVYRNYGKHVPFSGEQAICR